MALTLAESAKLSTNMVYKGVVQTAYTHSQILRFLPFMPIAGNAYQYARENTPSTADVYDPGDTITEGTSAFNQVTVALKRIIGDAEIDEFAQVTRSDQTDQTAVQLALKVRAVAEKFESLFITGDTGTSAKQFDGLRILCSVGSSNRIGCNNDAAAGASPTLDDIDRLIDTVKGPVDLLIMSQRSKRKLKGLFRAAGSSMESHAEFGIPIDYYANVPIATTNFIGDSLTKGSSTDCSEIYALSLAEGFGRRWPAKREDDGRAGAARYRRDPAARPERDPGRPDGNQRRPEVARALVFGPSPPIACAVSPAWMASAHNKIHHRGTEITEKGKDIDLSVSSVTLWCR